MTSFEPAETHSNVKLFVKVAIAIWFMLVFFLGGNGSFVRPPEVPAFPVIIGATVPVFVFIAAYLGSGAFRAFILSADIRFLTAIQAWRLDGLGFLTLYAHGLLPGLFAWPAGLGDIAIGVTTPWILLSLIYRPTFAASRQFIVWNLLGILDLIVALCIGVLSTGIVPGLVGEITSAPMTKLPLILITVFLAPLFIMLHLAALFQARRPVESGHSGELA